MNPLQRVKSLTVELQSPFSLYSSLPLEALIGSVISFVNVTPNETFVLDVLYSNSILSET